MRYHKNNRKERGIKSRVLMARFLTITVTKFKELPTAQRKKNQPTERNNLILIILELNNYTNARRKKEVENLLYFHQTLTQSLSIRKNM